MKTFHKNSIFALTTIALLLFQLAVPVTAFADDDPPPTPTDTPVVTSTPDPTETTLLVTDSPTPDDSSSPTVATVETSAPTFEEPTAAGTTENQATLLETVQTLSNTTNVVVLDENGQPLSLVSQEAADVIANSDPMWCPAGKTTVTAACITATTVTDLISQLGSNNVNGNGTIYFTNTYDTNDVTFDGTNPNLDQLADNSLTLQGGWGGDTTIGSAITYSGNSTFSVPITITSWAGDVTINNITVTDASGTGLTVYTQGNIALGNITSSNNSGDGIIVGTTGNIVMDNITLSENSTGITVRQGQNVTLNNITATNNNGGVWIAGLAGEITINTATLSNNIWWGLVSYENSGVHLIDVKANNNLLDNGVQIWTTGNITITGTDNQFNENGKSGLVLQTTAITDNGAIYLNHVTANGNKGTGPGGDGNSGTGIWIYNYMGTGNVVIRNSEFNNNALNGLAVFSNGNITLVRITAEGNQQNGVYLFTPHNAAIYATDIQNNTGLGVDASAVCGTFSINGSFDTVQLPVKGEHETTNPYGFGPPIIKIYCTPNVFVHGVLVYGAEPSNQYEFNLSCDTELNYLRTLPNGDKVTIFCEVSGKARLSRLDNTSLPADLPEGYLYASAFNLEILQGVKNEISIPVITEGGYIKASFDASHLQPGASYSILYFDKDTSTWIPLEDFMLGENGTSLSFDLLPGDPANNGRQIKSGVRLTTESGSPRIEVSTNFPGVFVLAQR